MGEIAKVVVFVGFIGLAFVCGRAFEDATSPDTAGLRAAIASSDASRTELIETLQSLCATTGPKEPSHD